MVTAKFPNTIWDGSSPSRSVGTAERGPDSLDWDQVTAEVQAAQTAVFDSGLTALTLANSWTAKSSYGVPSVRKIGNEVRLSGGATAGTVTNGTTITTLPGNCWPTSPRTFPICPAGSDTIGAAGNMGSRLLVSTDGTVKIYGATSVVSIDLSSVMFYTQD